MAKRLKAKIGKVLFTREQIDERLGTLATEIQKRYAAHELSVVAVLKGSLIFTADLVRRLEIPVRMDILEVRSYFDGTRSSEQMELAAYMVENLRGRHVLVVDDIVDTGETLAKVLEMIRAHGPKSVAVCVFLDKTPRRRRDVPIDFRAFRIDADTFVVGYGLDYAQRFRNLPHLAELELPPPKPPKRKPLARRPSATKKRPRRASKR